MYEEEYLKGLQDTLEKYAAGYRGLYFTYSLPKFKQKSLERAVTRTPVVRQLDWLARRIGKEDAIRNWYKKTPAGKNILSLSENPATSRYKVLGRAHGDAGTAWIRPERTPGTAGVACT
jgi:hypothetical protein